MVKKESELKVNEAKEQNDLHKIEEEFKNNLLNNQVLKLSQSDYIYKVISKYKLENANPIYIPMDTKIKLVSNINKATKEDVKQF